MTTKSEQGFTLPELVVVIVLSSLFISLILVFSINYWRYSVALDSDMETLVTRLNAGDYIREKIGESSGLIVQNSLADNNVLNKDPLIASGLYWKPIHAIPGNTPVGSTGTTTPLLYFRGLSTNTSRALIMNGVQPYEDEYVLYLNGTTKQLLARSLSNPNTANNRLLTSCPPTIATTNCPADKVIADNIASIDMRYFSRTGSLLDWTSATDPITGAYVGPDFSVVEVVELTLNLTKKATFYTNDTKNSTIIRIALRNT